MNSELKKAIGYMLLTILAGGGVYLTSILPDITLSGEAILVLTTVIGAVVLFLRKVVSIYTGVSIDEKEKIE